MPIYYYQISTIWQIASAAESESRFPIRICYIAIDYLSIPILPMAIISQSMSFLFSLHICTISYANNEVRYYRSKLRVCYNHTNPCDAMWSDAESKQMIRMTSSGK